MFISFTGDIDSFCRANPGAVKPVDTNCAQYYKCSNTVTGTVKYVQVCICFLFRYLICISCFTKLLSSHSTVGSVEDLRKGGFLFKPLAPPIFFQRHGDRIHSSLSILLMMVIWESSQWLGKNICAEYWLKELQESMDRCSGHHSLNKINWHWAPDNQLTINHL